MRREREETGPGDRSPETPPGGARVPMLARPRPPSGWRIGVGFALLVATPLLLAGEGVPGYRPFERGDVNVDANLSLVDATTILDYLFVPGTPPLPCFDAADVNDDDALSLIDAIDLLTYLFVFGAPPPAPFGTCGVDPTLNIALSCNEYPPCADLTSVDEAAHIMRRLGFGPTPGGLDYVLGIGADAYIEEQLHPELIGEDDNDLLQMLIADLEPEIELLDIIQLQVVRALYSERQLQEALAEFWENHFNTDISKHYSFVLNLRGDMNGPAFTPEEALEISVGWEYAENSVFRSGALGSFEDLLITSATSSAMIIYLDSIFNVAAAPNENYARELMELHTMGVDNGYTQVDIEEVARCFTGWSLCNVPVDQQGDPHAPCLSVTDPAGVLGFRFRPQTHDYGAKTIFAGTSYELNIPPRPNLSTSGIRDGFEVLTHLAGLPQTAEFVATKLIRRLVSDEPPPALVAECVVTWLATGGDLREVVSTILHSDHFLDRDHRWNKVYTPIEFLVAQTRAVDAFTNGGPLIFGAGGNGLTGLVGLNYIPFFFPTPDGRSEFGFDWLGSTDLLHRILFSHALAGSQGFNPSFHPIDVMIDAGVPLDQPQAIVDFWMTMVYQNFYTLAERDLAIEYLSTNLNGVATPLNLNSPGYEGRIRSAVGFILSGPQGQKQ